MRQVKYLTTKQNRIIEDLFTGNLEVLDVLKKWKVRLRTYCRWFEQENFALEFNRRLKLPEHQRQLIFARCTSSVAVSLVNLTGAAKEETARKACMDVINHPDRKIKNNSDNKNLPQPEPPEELPPEVASRLLSALAAE